MHNRHYASTSRSPDGRWRHPYPFSSPYPLIYRLRPCHDGVWLPTNRPPSVADPFIGAVVGAYRIERLIGRGGMGVVYLAEHTHLERKVALKVLTEDLTANEPFRQRFLRESRVAASLDHPNLVTVFDAGQVGDVLYIAMRYVEGTDLRDLLQRQGKLDVDESVRIVSQVAAALGYAHEKGLVHRDVKPGNILLAPTPAGQKAYLGDFGLTRASESVSDITQTGTFLGSIDYAAPEQWKNEKLDARTDLYALACVLYECLTGTVPFERDGQVAIMYAHMFDDPPKPSTHNTLIPPAVDEVIARALSKSADERYPSCESFMNEVEIAFKERAPSEQTVVATQAPPAAPHEPSPRGEPPTEVPLGPTVVDDKRPAEPTVRTPAAEERAPAESTTPSPAWQEEPQPASPMPVAARAAPRSARPLWIGAISIALVLAVVGVGFMLSRGEDSEERPGGGGAPAGDAVGAGGGAGPAGDLVVFRSDRDGDDEIFVMARDGSDVRQLTDNKAEDSDPAWSPDGERIAFQSDSDGDIDIYVMNADGSDLVKITNSPGDDTDPAWSPDGSRIAFSSNRDGDADIFVMDGDGGNVTRVTTNTDINEDDPSWTQDGTQIAYQTDQTGSDVSLIDVEGGVPDRLTLDIPGRAGDPELSPVADTIAFSLSEDIVVMGLETAEITKIHTGRSRESDPAFSPDGSLIYFQSNKDGDEDIYVVDATGGEATNLTKDDAFDADPDPQP